MKRPNPTVPEGIPVSPQSTPPTAAGSAGRSRRFPLDHSNKSRARGHRALWNGVLLALLWLLATPANAAEVLFVHAPSGGVPSATDQSLINEISLGLGHKVKLRAVSGAAEKPAATEAASVDLVIVSESVGSANVGDAFKDVTKPVLLLEAFIADDMLVAVPGSVSPQAQADILLPDHPLAAGLSGTVDIYKAAKTLSTFTSVSTDAIQVVSAAGQPATGALIAFLPGAKMESDFIAPGRRVCLGLHSAVPEEYTSQARALFRAAVTWSLTPEKTVLFVHAPSGGVPSATDQSLINEISLGLGYKVKLRPVSSAAEKPAATEAASVDLVIVSESVGSANVGDAFKDVTKPVLLLEAFIADDMLVAVPGSVSPQAQADILLPDHPLAAGLSGTVDIYKAAKTLSTFTSVSTDAIQVVSAAGQPATGALIAFLPGAKMETDFIAPGRRVCLGLHSAVPEEYTSQARALFRAAVTWSLTPEKTVLFVHAPSGGVPSATDQSLINEISLGLGHKVKLRPVSSAAEKPAATEADSVDLVIVSESVGSANVGDAFKDVTKPVLLLEAFIADDMLVAVPGSVSPQAQADILLPDHPLAAGLSGTVDIYKAAKTLSTFTSVSTDAIQVVSAAGQPATGALIAFLAGAKMETDFLAPGRRVCLGLHSAVPEEYTSQARALFRAAVTWSMTLPIPTTGSQSKPVIARQPADGQVFVGQQAELAVEARGSVPLTYQWKRADKDITGATASILRFEATPADDGVAYTVTVKNAQGSVTSLPARVKVLPENGRKVLLGFSEGSGTITTNLGNLGGSAKFALGNNYPKFSTQVPTGPMAPAGNVGSVDFGSIDETDGGRAIDFTNPFSGSIGSYKAVTICGWLNSRDLRTGPGGNRIVFAAAGVGGLGFDLAQSLDGSLRFGVNQVPDNAPQSTPVITEDANTGAANWVFFAVTYDSEQAAGNVSFYFGRGDAAATLDTTHDYAQGAIERTGLLSLGNFAAVDLNRNVQGPDQSRVFRGLMDEIRIFRSVLSLAEIQAQQKSVVKPPAVPIPLAVANSAGGLVISWAAGGDFVLESNAQLGSGSWSRVTATPVVAGGRNSVTLPPTGASQFYRLRSP